MALLGGSLKRSTSSASSSRTAGRAPHLDAAAFRTLSEQRLEHVLREVLLEHAAVQSVAEGFRLSQPRLPATGTQKRRGVVAAGTGR